MKLLLGVVESCIRELGNHWLSLLKRRCWYFDSYIPPMWINFWLKNQLKDYISIWWLTVETNQALISTCCLSSLIFYLVLLSSFFDSSIDLFSWINTNVLQIRLFLVQSLCPATIPGTAKSMRWLLSRSSHSSEGSSLTSCPYPSGFCHIPFRQFASPCWTDGPSTHNRSSQPNRWYHRSIWCWPRYAWKLSLPSASWGYCIWLLPDPWSWYWRVWKWNPLRSHVPGPVSWSSSSWNHPRSHRESRRWPRTCCSSSSNCLLAAWWVFLALFCWRFPWCQCSRRRCSWFYSLSPLTWLRGHPLRSDPACHSTSSSCWSS